MKKLILALTLVASASAFAGEKAMIFPNVYNYGHSVMVSVWNHTDRNVSCSGPLYLTYQSNVRETEYFFETVWSRQTTYRNVYPRRMNDRITMVSHSISCF